MSFFSFLINFSVYKHWQVIFFYEITRVRFKARHARFASNTGHLSTNSRDSFKIVTLKILTYVLPMQFSKNKGCETRWVLIEALEGCLEETFQPFKNDSPNNARGGHNCFWGHCFAFWRGLFIVYPLECGLSWETLTLWLTSSPRTQTCLSTSE